MAKLTKLKKLQEQYQQDNIRMLLDKYFTPAKRQKILEVVMDMAEAKNLEAVKLLWSYCYGKAPETINVQQAGGITVRVVYGKASKTDPK